MMKLVPVEVQTIAVSTAFCVFSLHYSHKRNLEKNKRRCSYAQPHRAEMSIETLSPARLSPVGAACLLSKIVQTLGYYSKTENKFTF